VLKAQICAKFGVASIKVNTRGDGGGYPELAPGGRRFIATNQLILMPIMTAYEVSPSKVLDKTGLDRIDRLIPN
jgi:hypothetical protein